MMSMQHREAKAIRQQLVSMNLKHFLLQTLKDPKNCTCQLETKTLDTTADGYYDIDLGSFRSGCDFSLANNFIVVANQEVKGGSGLTVESVKISGIQYTGTSNGPLDSYSGALTVAYSTDNVIRALRSIEVDILFTVDNTSGPANARLIQGCLDNSAMPLSNIVQKKLLYYSSSGKVIPGHYTNGVLITLSEDISNFRFLVFSGSGPPSPEVAYSSGIIPTARIPTTPASPTYASVAMANSGNSTTEFVIWRVSDRQINLRSEQGGYVNRRYLFAIFGIE